VIESNRLCVRPAVASDARIVLVDSMNVKQAEAYAEASAPERRFRDARELRKAVARASLKATAISMLSMLGCLAVSPVLIMLLESVVNVTNDNFRAVLGMLYLCGSAAVGVWVQFLVLRRIGSQCPHCGWQLRSLTRGKRARLLHQGRCPRCEGPLVHVHDECDDGRELVSEC
jgi:hypothetical protein